MWVLKTNTAEQCLSLEQNDYSQNDFFAICSIQDPFIKILRKDFCCGVMSHYLKDKLFMHLHLSLYLSLSLSLSLILSLCLSYTSLFALFLTAEILIFFF